MGRTFVYSFSLLFLLNCGFSLVQAQDTIPIPLKVKVGIEVSGPAIYYSNKNMLNEEGYISIDLNEKRSAFLSAGYSRYKYSQYNYSFLNHGSFIRVGMDFNLLKPDKSLGKYFAGIGLRYGLSRFSYEAPYIEKDNYWGAAITSLPQRSYWGHFIEASPGVRAEILNHVSFGWSISIRMLIHTSTGSDLKPVYIPGFGDGTKSITAGLSYFIVWNIPYKKINAIIKKEVKEENDDNDENNPNNTNNNNSTSGNRQQGTDIRR